MSHRTFAVIVSLICLWAGRPVTAGKYNPDRSIGDPAPAWSKLPGVDGQEHSLEELKSKDVIVVVFTCNSCPYAADYEDRINEFAKKHGGDTSRVALVAMNVNKVAADLPPAMRERAKSKGFVFPYLFDETQQIARDFGATRTPEFFVLDKNRRIAYMGAMDDNPDPAMVKSRYVEDAVRALLAGEVPATKETAPVGCAVRYARQRPVKAK